MTISAAEEKRLREIAEREGIDDPDEFIAAARDAEANEENDDGKETPRTEKDAEKRADKPDADADDGEGKKGVAERLLLGHLHYIKVNELRARLGFSSVDGGDEYCTEFAIKRGMLPDPQKGGAAPPTEGE